jgi:hypothetical protein
VTDVTISGIDANVALSGCSFTVTGSAPGYYSNSAHTLTMTTKPKPAPVTNPKVSVSNASGCAGVFSNGDELIYTCNYKLSPATLSITADRLAPPLALLPR